MSKPVSQSFALLVCLVATAATLPSISLPDQATWDGMSPTDQALILVNDERAAPGVPPLEGQHALVTGVAQAFADWLLTNDAWGHDQDWDTDGTVESP